MKDLPNATDGFLTTEELAEEERELQRLFEEDNFVPDDVDPFDEFNDFHEEVRDVS